MSKTVEGRPGDLARHATMIDRPKRDELARLLRLFLRGRLTVDELQVGAPDGGGGDPGVTEIGFELDDWLGDQPRHARAADCVTPEVRADLLRLLLFLHGDQEYRWRLRDVLPWPLRRLGGDPEAWPFYTNAALEEALRCPRFLKGLTCPTSVGQLESNRDRIP